MPKIEEIRHSLAHLLAAAVQKKFPKTKLGIGPAIENGFYYDFLFEKPISEKDLKKLEKEMKNLISQNLPFKREIWSYKKAKEFFKDQPFKLELIEEKSDKKTVQIYKTGNFFDFCKGGHVKNTKEINPTAFCLQRIAGAYWKGNEKNPMLTRIYGLAFETKKELEDFLEEQKQIEKNDHRKIGAQQELFFFHEMVGPGLVLWLPKGTIIRQELEKWAVATEKKWGYVRVATPHVAKEELFKTSGHLPYYQDAMYPKMALDDAVYYLKAMNCPMHHLIFKAKPRSYKDLPLRLAEYGDDYRYEKSGELFGLMRVRGMRMNDAHIYCTKAEAIEEFVSVIKLHQYYYEKLGIKNYYMELSLRDPKKKKYLGSEKMWRDAENFMKKAMEKSGVPYLVAKEGAAFYGPKIDFQIKSAIGKIFTASTNQIDFFMAERFDLEYTDKNGLKKRPVIIHRAPLGTHERFIGFLIEHFKGSFPVWLAPEQVWVLPISQKHLSFAQKIFDQLFEKEIRVVLKPEDQTLPKRIKEGIEQKIPYLIIIGDKEVRENIISVRQRGSAKTVSISFSNFLEKISKEIQEKTLSLEPL
jgi:threonyl-tRNA synthetase